MSSIDESKQFIPLNIAVLTISDTRTLADDKSGTTLSERLTAAGHNLAAREIILDDVDAIRSIIKKWIADPGVDAIITTGGTGFTRRAAMRGMSFSRPSSITARGPAISSRSCRGWTNICDARKPRAHRSDLVIPGRAFSADPQSREIFMRGDSAFAATRRPGMTNNN